MNYEAFFSPFNYKSLHLRNRFVMAPMTRVQSPDGVPTEQVAEYYGRRAGADVGLIVTEGTTIDRPSSKNQKDIPDFHGNAALQNWKNIADTVHANGGAIAPQIWHVGNTPYGWQPPAPFEGPETMSLNDIRDTIEAFGKAAKSAKEIGFDAIEIHGAHGYLIDQFFWDKTNNRTDEYGGKTLKERTRFGVEVVKAIRAAIGEEMAIILRLSQWKGIDFNAKMAHNPAELESWVQPLADAGVDIFHASQRRYWEPEFDGSDLNFAGWIKKLTGAPTITVGSVGLNADVTSFFAGGAGAESAGFEELLRRFERGDFDLIAVGRQLLQDPEWVKKLKEGRLDEISAFKPESAGTYY
ncbi:NADH:flavin oxidoreductase [Mucilaginibacter achroorhodeus]|uniref:NADH:flavin oxidoreductase n=1 Tax=Mucilaginibacter achroorhodeus TaxID=2599294 RepID=A0A563UB12_9SPHI|nr:NADH:flavin oxidoreductase [Mucilaginibacter achroorhodeus]TWR28551.1 NADH:flavin oxidoreductase [Mucilaginibacter achroorhodeus]